MTARDPAARLIDELRAEGITDERVLKAIAAVPREQFVPAAFRDRAYENVALPIGHGQTISQPYIVALMTQALEVGDRHIVLEIGAGSGYQAAVLAQLTRRVFTVERHRAMAKTVEEKLKQLRISNVTVRFGDGTKAWPEQSSFDRIIVTAAAASLSDALMESLAEGGVLVAPIGEDKRDQMLMRLRRTPQGWQSEELCPVRFVPLVAGLPRGASR
ncbi:MAG TPA: protein-L-isoaspartate(D-aspartate) O-methyltransferase [Stellaceae bacterium]|jgi:protein-L-isoaspartate(D-aspartate) O-methyltransferase|nr:protein-L-isoaspartate(D-aspartate) O-methyltransferase [Stellaceae bacterium]